MEDEVKALKHELRLYRQYVNVMEHIYVFDGGIALEGKEYDKEWLTRGSRSWLNNYRELLADHIKLITN